ncbi:MAG: hypothetical protein WD342_04430 [Verrucomicrobiales bacterium]
MIKKRVASFLTVGLLWLHTAMAEPPVDLVGQALSLDGERLEFHDSASGNDESSPFSYHYEVTDALGAALRLEYADLSRIRDITLSFLADGSPDGFSEVDSVVTDPPMPPLVRSGAFEIELLEAEPIVSTAPDDLVGLYLNLGSDRFEFLTEVGGRLFLPGTADYFSYSYEIVDESSALATIQYLDGSSAPTEQTQTVLLSFDAESDPLLFVSTLFENSAVVEETSGEFDWGINRHLADLRIGREGLPAVGNDIFNGAGRWQMVRSKLRAIETVAYLAVLENDGTTDTMSLRGTRGRRNHDVKYFTALSHANITGAVTTGRYVTDTLNHGDETGIIVEITPQKPRGAIVTGLKATSDSVDGARDLVKTATRVHARKAKGRSNGRAKGRAKAKTSAQSRGKGKKARR